MNYISSEKENVEKVRMEGRKRIVPVLASFSSSSSSPLSYAYPSSFSTPSTSLSSSSCSSSCPASTAAADKSRAKIGSAPSTNVEELSTLGDIFPALTAMRSELDGCFEKYETGKSVAVEQRIGALLNQFNRVLDKMKGVLAHQTHDLSSSELRLWERRIRKLEDDGELLLRSFEKQLGHIHSAQIEAAQRRKLLGDNSQKAAADAERDAILGLAREREKLMSSHTMLDSITEQGRHVVDRMFLQNKTLKGAKRKLLDVGSNLGVSSSLVGVISRRHAVDRWLVYACMLITVVVFLSLYNYVKTGKVFTFAFIRWRE